MITRKYNWLPVMDKGSEQEIAALEKKLAIFYRDSANYYGDIDFTADNWINTEEKGYHQIISFASESKKICEFGCGNANILKHFPQFQDRYSGCDFSGELIQKNQGKYPKASFKVIDVPNALPYADGMFDLIFSVFVLEHSTHPAKLLDECKRVLAPGGRLVILCPDFLGEGRMPSQRSGWSSGNSTSKLKKGKYLDAMLTLFDNRVRTPFHCKTLRSKAEKQPQFFINVNPIVFEDKFTPDVDAVYVTYKKEIIKYLDKDFILEANSASVKQYEADKKLIFLSSRKK